MGKLMKRPDVEHGYNTHIHAFETRWLESQVRARASVMVAILARALGMKIRLTKQEIVALFACLRQAERSLDAALRADWQSFRAWYEAGRREFLEEQASMLRVHLPADAPPDAAAQDVCSDLWLVLVRGTLNRVRRTWRFEPPQIRALFEALCAIRACIDEPTRPPDEQLVQLRLRIAACRQQLEFRLFGVAALRRADKIEHFMQAEHVKPISTNSLRQTARSTLPRGTIGRHPAAPVRR